MTENYDDFDDFDEMAHDVRRTIEREREELMERAERLNVYMQLLDRINELVSKNRRLRDDYEEALQQLDDEKQQRAELEMKLREMSKLSADVAKKASEDNLLKALRTYVNRSKRKTADKRTFAKSATLEIANVNGVVLPEDLAAAIDSLDDEQPEPKVVNVAGDYNDVHDNDNVFTRTKNQ